MTNYIASLVDELYQLGVRDVVISPGSRSTPLAMLFCEHDFNVYMNIDERSAAFFGLGIAKGNGKPVVLLCTSGSAAANYLPAVIEAKHARVPMIILTADRPHELRNCGAPQTIDQIKLFSDAVKHFEELAPAEDSGSMCHYVRGVMDRAYAKAMADGCGVVHINIPIREPLVPDFEVLDFSFCRKDHNFNYSEGEMHGFLDEDLLREKNGIILCGGDGNADYHEEVLALAKRLKAPVLADPLSNMRNHSVDCIVDSYDGFLKMDDVKDELRPDYIIQFGQTPVSKRLQQFIARHGDVLYIQVDSHFDYRNPALSTHYYIKASAKSFADGISTEHQDDRYLKKWQTYHNMMRAVMNSAREEDQLFEGKLIQMIQSAIPENSNLVVANSMSIRYVDAFFQAREQDTRLYCNRGANGIEGIVSTALGMSTTGKPTVLVTGDLSFYHDLNGLLAGKTHGLNLVIVLLNNDGGGIFEFLPQRHERHYDDLFATAHGMNFEGLATLYGIEYFEIRDYHSFQRAFEHSIRAGGINLIEVKLNSEISKVLHDQYTVLKGEANVYRD